MYSIHPHFNALTNQKGSLGLVSVRIDSYFTSLVNPLLHESDINTHTHVTHAYTQMTIKADLT